MIRVELSDGSTRDFGSWVEVHDHLKTRRGFRVVSSRRVIPVVDVPIHDAERDMEVAFVMTFYGLPLEFFTAIPIANTDAQVWALERADAAGELVFGGSLIQRRLRRLGLDTDRFRAMLWTVQKGREM